MIAQSTGHDVNEQARPRQAAIGRLRQFLGNVELRVVVVVIALGTSALMQNMLQHFDTRRKYSSCPLISAPIRLTCCRFDGQGDSLFFCSLEGLELLRGEVVECGGFAFGQAVVDVVGDFAACGVMAFIFGHFPARY